MVRPLISSEYPHFPQLLLLPWWKGSVPYGWSRFHYDDWIRSSSLFCFSLPWYLSQLFDVWESCIRVKRRTRGIPSIDAWESTVSRERARVSATRTFPRSTGWRTPTDPGPLGQGTRQIVRTRDPGWNSLNTSLLISIYFILIYFTIVGWMSVFTIFCFSTYSLSTFFTQPLSNFTQPVTCIFICRCDAFLLLLYCSMQRFLNLCLKASSTWYCHHGIP